MKLNGLWKYISGMLAGFALANVLNGGTAGPSPGTGMSIITIAQKVVSILIMGATQIRAILGPGNLSLLLLVIGLVLAYLLGNDGGSENPPKKGRPPKKPPKNPPKEPPGGKPPKKPPKEPPGDNPGGGLQPTDETDNDTDESGGDDENKGLMDYT